MNCFNFSFLILFFMLSVACEKNSEKSGIPECVNEIIVLLEKEDCPSVGMVVEYQFMGGTVYVIEPRNCGADLTSQVVDSNCQTLCYLGGITGNIMCNEVNFYDEATARKQVYP